MSTGLIYYRARWYDPQQGRFLSEDPISYEGGFNLYSYVDNDPIGFTDPLGLQSPKPMPAPTPFIPPTSGKEKCCDNTGGDLSPGLGRRGPPVSPRVSPRVGPVGAAGAAGAGFVATGGTLLVIAGIVGITILLRPKPKPSPNDNPFPPKPSPCPEPKQADNNDEDCEEQYQSDIDICRRLATPRARARCYASAMDRKVACENNKPIPPLVVPRPRRRKPRPWIA